MVIDKDVETTTPTADKDLKQLQQLQISMLEQLHHTQISTLEQLHHTQISTLKQLHQLQISTNEKIVPNEDNCTETAETAAVKRARIATPTTDKHIEETTPTDVEHVEETIPTSIGYVETTVPTVVRYAKKTTPTTVKLAEATIPTTVKHVETTTPAIANPAPLGLCAFALTTFVLSAHNIGLFKGGAVVVGLALFYGGLVQLLAGMWEFRSNNTFGALAFTSYGAFWLATGWALQNNQVTDGFRYVLVAWAFFTFIGFLGTLKTNMALISVFSFLTITFVVLAIGAFTGINTWTQFGGWLGMVTAALAWYTATAVLLSSIKGAFTLPTFPIN